MRPMQDKKTSQNLTLALVRNNEVKLGLNVFRFMGHR
jgi:hypothetical protein